MITIVFVKNPFEPDKDRSRKQVECTGEISDRVFNYLVDASKNSFYTLSDEMSEFFEKNHYFKKSDFDIQDFSVEIFRYFINEGVIVIHEDN